MDELASSTMPRVAPGRSGRYEALPGRTGGYETPPGRAGGYFTPSHEFYSYGPPLPSNGWGQYGPFPPQFGHPMKDFDRRDPTAEATRYVQQRGMYMRRTAPLTDDDAEKRALREEIAELKGHLLVAGGALRVIAEEHARRKREAASVDDDDEDESQAHPPRSRALAGRGRSMQDRFSGMSQRQAQSKTRKRDDRDIDDDESSGTGGEEEEASEGAEDAVLP